MEKNEEKVVYLYAILMSVLKCFSEIYVLFYIMFFVQGEDRMSESRHNPDQLSKEIQTDEEKRNKGHLKIFFGYAAGVGKTYAMLEAAHMEKQQGIDVVAGYVEPHARPQTAALLNGLEVLPTREVFYNGMILDEFDIGMALKKKTTAYPCR